ncbi:hypothetical protein EDD85DRAFT_740159, partial [Armillaria nabsnona]
RICVSKTYLTGPGYCHAATHEEYVDMGEVVGGAVKDLAELSALNTKGFLSVEKGEEDLVRPAHTGLRVSVHDALVWDGTY